MRLVVDEVKPASAPAKPLFDGKSLDGWEGNLKYWRVENDCINGGSTTEDIKSNEFLATKAEYGNFVLKLKFKLTGNGGFINSGIQIRSQRVAGSTEMAGYQCDLGDPSWWGSIYDESRRNKVMASSNMKAIEPVLKRNDWNEYMIKADGPRIQTFINGVQGVDYTEADVSIVQTGHIGIQVHAGGKPTMLVKEITIEELPATPAKAAFVPAPEPGKSGKVSPLTGAEQQATFTLPPGFEIELVAEEAPGYGKFITTTWDTAGRLWTMTAMEYPVDGNENREAAKALYASIAKDKVLVYDLEDRGSKTSPARYAAKPRVFAEGLAIPLGLLPYNDGCIVQHGEEIVFLRDTNGDGKADEKEVLLTGVGIDDSHLFLHGFTRGPGGWIYTAQGAFNHSQIKTRDGQVTKWDFCKMGRFTPDGRKFELVAAGLNNIWGFVIDRGGRMFGQEANDMGYPLTEMEVGDNYPGIGNEKLKPYAPVRPAPVKDWQVGGTGLSGLALAEDLGFWPKPYGPDKEGKHRMFYLANPITNRIQASEAIEQGEGFQFKKVKDFVRSSDPWFRPVHIDFGPDGCLYIVDWYNKIISHNEVPRNFPERDKTRGRIWRVRHTGQPKVTIPDLSQAKPEQLVAELASPVKWNAKTAAELLETNGQPVPVQAQFHWKTNDRRAAFLAMSVQDLLKQAPAADGTYEHEFPRYLIRAALETKQVELVQFLASPEATAIAEETRIFACLALPELDAAKRLATLLPGIKRPLREEELLPLASQAQLPESDAALRKLLENPANVELLVKVKTKLDATKLKSILSDIAKSLVKSSPALAVKLAGSFKLNELEPQIADALPKAAESEVPALLQVLRELGSKRIDLFEPLAKSANAAIQSEALKCLAVAPEKLLPLWNSLNATQRKECTTLLTATKQGASSFIEAISKGTVAKDDVDGPMVERLQAVLGDQDAALKSLLESMGDLFRPVLFLMGDDGDGGETEITLDGPFTVETWVRLDPNIGNADGLLGVPGSFDFNFYDGKARLYLGAKGGDVIVSKKTITPDAWTHIGLTRDEKGRFKLYINGELDTDQSRPDTQTYEHLKLGVTSANGGTSGAFTEYRIWNVCRTAAELRANFDRALETPGIPGLVSRFAGTSWPKLQGKARVSRTTDFPNLVTPEQAKALDEKFAKFRSLAEKPGDAAKGQLYAAVCMGCHQIKGVGGMIGPNLSGIGAMGTDAILRNILTPNAAMEAGYRVYQIVLKDGTVKEGFLAQEDANAIILRTPGAEDQRFSKAEIRKSQFLKRSLMPEGLMDGFTPEMVTDLMTYLLGVK